MKITLVSLYDVHSIAIRLLSSILENRNFDVTSIFFKDHYSDEVVTEGEIDILVDEILNSSPDVVGFSLRSNFFPIYKDIYKKIKKLDPELMILIGGHHPTIAPEWSLKYSDAICVGEGEIPIIEFCERFRYGKEYIRGVRNIYTHEDYLSKKSLIPKNNLIQNLDELPLPKYSTKDIYVVSKFKFEEEIKMSVLTARGCFFNCSFCYNETYKNICRGLGKYIRRRSVDNVIKEINRLKFLFPLLQEISFADNVFTFDKKWVDEFCEKFRDIDLKFRCFSHPKMIDENMLKSMKDAGCHMVTIGFQSGSERIRKEYYNRHETNEEVIRSSEILNNVGIKARYDRIINLPYETEEDEKENNILISKLKRPFTIRYLYLVNHPNTPLTKRLLRDGYITEMDIEGNKGSAYKQAGTFIDYGD